MAHALLRAASALKPTLGAAALKPTHAAAARKPTHPAAVRVRVRPTYHHYVEVTRRRLPHIYPKGRWLFITWSLYGSLPQARYPPPEKASAGEAFVWMDRYLDLAQTGPLFLRQDAIAELVVNALLHGVELGHYQLDSFVVMANHVHVLLLPLTEPSRLMQSLKGYTAREANRLLGRTGETFWQRESYDHWVRNTDEMGRIAAYIENNPVKAGLVSKAEDYMWSSANPRWEEQLCKLPATSVGLRADAAR